MTRLLITAGPTREKIDPIRFISNYSTGTFGYEIAKEAKKRGCLVTLISGPTALEVPSGVKFIGVESALDMRKAVLREFPESDCVIMAAAVSDWRVRSAAKRKVKRGSARTLTLVENPDIIAQLGKKKRHKILVGFALETEDLIKNAEKKLTGKNLDLVIANRCRPKSSVFGDAKPDITIIDRFDGRSAYFGRTKKELAKIILDKVLSFKI